jgi:HNH endonuclease
MHTYSSSIRAEAIRLRLEERLSATEISRKVGCSRAIALYWLRGMPRTKEEKYPKRSKKDRLMERITVDPISSCWLWTGRLSHNGYPRVAWRITSTHQAHRIAYEEFIGPIPAGMVLDHTCHRPENCPGGKGCKHRRCINPVHLEPVTIRENLRRGHGPAAGLRAAHAQRASVTHCPQGHKYTTKNTYTYQGCRSCKACAQVRGEKRNALLKERRRICRESKPPSSCS